MAVLPSNLLKRTNTQTATTMNGMSILHGAGFVGRDAQPNRRERTENVSVVSKAQVMEFTPNGSIVATAHQNSSIKFWDSDMLFEKYAYNVASSLTQISFSPRRELMATSDNLN